MEAVPVHVNQYPGDWAIPALKLDLIVKDGRWKTVSPSGVVRTARGHHLFIVQQGRLIVAKGITPLGMPRPIGHIDLAPGDPIEFGGEIRFGASYSARGRLQWWNDRTGHYHDPLRPMDPAIVPMLPRDDFVRFG